MKELALVFPDRLFETNPIFKKGRDIFLLEETLFFNLYPFHKKKLVLHRASMKSYEMMLQNQGFKPKYISAQDENCDIKNFVAAVGNQGYSKIYITALNDEWLSQRLLKACSEHNIILAEETHPGFLTSAAEIKKYFATYQYFQTAFYIYQRKRLGILIDGAQQPSGGKWSLDAENRKRFPAKGIVPRITMPSPDKFVQEASEYVNHFYPNNYGDTDDFFYPINVSQARAWLQDFLTTRLAAFGPYEDAIVTHAHFLHHSVLSPLLNIGLLTPAEVVAAVVQYAERKNVPLNSTEGFIRQVIGWREFIRAVYLREGTKQRTTNFFKFKRKIPRSFWEGTTGILPVDHVIKKVLGCGWCHHIERLMVMGNFMLLCEFDPNETYRWFMELFVDSYDWVMVPNVYGIAAFADGGLMVTKPYISGSNYILKMSDHKKGSWCDTWDALFWRFIIVHRPVFESNQRWKMLTSQIDKMPAEKKDGILKRADEFLNSLHNDTDNAHLQLSLL